MIRLEYTKAEFHETRGDVAGWERIILLCSR